ncbi:MAG: hypothetical protein ISQ32_04370 [Rickettsiales bacterium]|nr:hypothetical protein [Rickettsiales bacterium]
MNKNFVKAFNSVELIVVLVVIGLLMSVFIKSSNIKKNAFNNFVIKETNVLLTSVMSFRVKYGGLPGDIVDGSHLFGANCGTEAQCNGNGDGYIALSSSDVDEIISSVIHLSLSGMLNSTYTRTNYAYPYKKKGVGFIKYVKTSDGYQVNDNAIVIQKDISDYDFIEPFRALQIDNKFDDGDPDTGYVTYFSGLGSNCVSAGEYLKADDVKTCSLVFSIPN